MRSFVLSPVLMVMLGLVAWAQRSEPLPLEVLIFDSLAIAIATDALPVFEAELRAELAATGHTVVFHRSHLSHGEERLPALPLELPDADLVVSFGALATERASEALRGATTPHLFAFVPSRVASDVMANARSEGQQPPTGLSGQIQGSSAFAIAARLLGTRPGSPLRIGLVHPAPSHVSGFAPDSAGDGQELGRFVDVPFERPPDASPEAVLASVVAATMEAAALEPAVDAFWLALEVAGPVDLLVQAIEEGTSRPVLFAPTEGAVAAGALMSLAPEPVTTAREAAMLARLLLGGTEPSVLPVRTPRRVELALNLTTAEALQIIPPHELLELARGRLFR